MNCPNCNEAVQSSFAFCEACGHRLESTAAAREAPAAAAAGAPGAVPVCACGGTVFDPEGFCTECGKRETEVSASDAIDIQALGGHAASASHRGRRHRDNQDAVGMLEIGSALAMVVADGVSTSYHARQAADLAVRETLEALKDCGGIPVRERISVAVRRAHAAICKLPSETSRQVEPESTLVMALVEGNQAWYAWVGDSRLYAFHPPLAKQLTVDDSLINEQLSAGVPMSEAATLANSHCITQCLGMRDDEMQIHVDQVKLQPGAWLLLCSDGLWNYCSDADVLWARINACGADASLSERCRNLVDFANASGGQDNVTVALYRHPG